MRAKHFGWMFLIFVFLFHSVKSDEIKSLYLNQIYELHLDGQSSIKYEITIPDSLQPDQNLYITGYSTFNRPDEYPNLEITTQGYQLKCQVQQKTLNDVCFVPFNKLKKGLKFVIQASCQLQCDSRLVAYLSKTVQLDLNQEVQISTQDSPTETLFKIVIPSNFNYTQINLVIGLESSYDIRGFNIYVKSSPTFVKPSESLRQNVRLMNWGLKQAIVLSKNIHFKTGDSLYVLLSVEPNTILTFQSRYGTAQTRFLSLNQGFYDYISYPITNRTYNLDLSSQANSNYFSEPIIVQIYEYSGSPKIQLSLDEKFTHEQIIKATTHSTRIRFQISPDEIKSSEKKTIYIRISSVWGSTYQINSREKMGDFDQIYSGETQYIEVKPNNFGISYYRFRKQLQNATFTYTTNIRIQNEGQYEQIFQVYSCKQSKSQQCRYNKSSDNSKLTTLTTIKNSFDYEVNYQPSDCLIQENYYFCTFIFVLQSENVQQGGRYALTIQKQSFAIALSEKKSYQGSVEKQQYAYFMFFLPESSNQGINPVLSLSFLVTTLDGSVNLYSSGNVNFPTQQHKSNPSVKQSVNLITYQRFEVVGGINYYLTVYGVEYSDFVVNVLIRRSGSPTQYNSIQMSSNQILGQSVKSTQIQLSDGVAQTFSLPIGYEHIQFRFQAFSNSTLTLFVYQLQGSVSTSVVDEKTHTSIICLNNQCNLNASSGDKFFVTVSGKKYAYQTFSIVYKQVKPCYKYPVGTPIFVSLDAKENICIDFLFHPDQPIQVSNSLTNLQLLDKDVDIVINFIESNKSILMSSNSYIFEVSDLKNYCLPKQISACNVEIKFISFDDPIELQFVIQRIDGLITLYDGVSQRMDTVISKTVGKYFRLPLASVETVEIFLMSQTSSEYIISAKVLPGPQSSQLNMYPKPSGQQQSIWRSITSQDFLSLTTLSISKAKLSSSISAGKIINPWLALTIFGKGDQNQHVSFNIEITQKERMLRQGQQQIGYLQPNQIVSYQIYPSVVSLLSVRSLYNKKCFTILDENDRQVQNEEIFIEQPRKIPLVYKIKSAQNQKCMYQISLQDYENSILTIAEGFSTRVILQYQQKTFFMYYHNRNQSFRIFEFIETGSSSLYATPLLSDKDIGKGISDIVDDSRLSSFVYKSEKVKNLQIEAKETDNQYCFNCYYLIAVKGSPAVHEEIVIVKQSSPVVLREHALVDSYLDGGQVERFIYYSGNQYAQFNLSIDAIYGKVTVRVKRYNKNPKGELIKVQTVQKTSVNLQITKGIEGIGGLGGQGSQTPNSLDEQNKYVFQVQGMSKLSLYHLQVLKYSNSFRIVQGLSSKVTIPAGGFLEIQFDNLIEQGQLQFDASPLLTQIIPEVFYRQPGLPKENSILISSNGFSRVGKVGSIYFFGKRGHFTFKLRNIVWGPVDIVVQIPKPGITQFRQQYTLISKRQNILEIYIPENNYAIIQLYVCQGNVKVRGSNQLKDVQRSSPKRSQILLTHENIGGHYVITTPENVTGQYFLRIQNKEFKAMISAGVSGIKYLINYRIHETKHKNPYSLLQVQSYSLKIFRSQEKQNITISLSKIKSTSPQMKVKSIRYIFSIGKSYEEVKQFLTCQTNDPKHLSFLVVGDESFDQVYLNISKHTVLERIGPNQDSYIGALALALVQYDGGAKYSDNIVYIYQPSFLSGIQTEKILTTVGFFEIMVIIFTVVGGVIVCYALVIYFIRIYRGYSNTNELIEQQSKQESDQIKFEVSSQKVEDPKIEEEIKQSEEKKYSD